jgi:hypothetical protein
LSKATWVDPSGRLNVLSREASIPDPAVTLAPPGTVSGGHRAAHWPVQVVWPGLSVVSR